MLVIEQILPVVYNKTDIKVGGFRYYLDYLSDAAIRQHNLDPLSLV